MEPSGPFSHTNGDRARLVVSGALTTGTDPLDSSAAIAYLDKDDPLHSSAVQALETAMRDGDGLAVSAVGWAEMLNGAYSGHHDERRVREFMADFGVPVLSVDADIAERAAQLQRAYRRADRKRARELRLRTLVALNPRNQRRRARRAPSDRRR